MVFTLVYLTFITCAFIKAFETNAERQKDTLTDGRRDICNTRAASSMTLTQNYNFKLFTDRISVDKRCHTNKKGRVLQNKKNLSLFCLFYCLKMKGSIMPFQL